jgi:predicted RNA-binding Zn ribbon-like protein
MENCRFPCPTPPINLYSTAIMTNQKEQFLKNGFGNTLWLDIVNSEYYDGFGNLTDHLKDSEWFRILLEQYQFDDISQDLLHQQLIDLRTWLRHIAQTLNRNNSLTHEDIHTLNSYLVEPGIRTLHYSQDQGKYLLIFKPVQSGWRWVLAEVVSTLVEMLDPKQQKRVKICANPGCKWVFFDVTKGNNRRWCNDLTCGNRDKVRRYRSRQNTS